MSEKTFEVSFSAIFIASNTTELLDIIKSIQLSEIARKSDEYNINANIIVAKDQLHGDPTLWVQ